MKTLLALVLLFDISALSGTSQVFGAKPVNSDAPSFAQSFAPRNQTFPEPGFDLGPRSHFTL